MSMHCPRVQCMGLNALSIAWAARCPMHGQHNGQHGSQCIVPCPPCRTKVQPLQRARLRQAGPAPNTIRISVSDNETQFRDSERGPSHGPAPNMISVRRFFSVTPRPPAEGTKLQHFRVPPSARVRVTGPSACPSHGPHGSESWIRVTGPSRENPSRQNPCALLFRGFGPLQRPPPISPPRAVDWAVCSRPAGRCVRTSRRRADRRPTLAAPDRAPRPR